MQNWEYKVIMVFNPSLEKLPSGEHGARNPEAELNEAGGDGWELIQVVTFPRGGGVSVCHYLKRPKVARSESGFHLSERGD